MRFEKPFNSGYLQSCSECVGGRPRNGRQDGALQNLIFYREPPMLARCDGVAACLDFAGVWVEALPRPMDAATRLCSSGVSWKI